MHVAVCQQPATDWWLDINNNHNHNTSSNIQLVYWQAHHGCGCMLPQTTGWCVGNTTRALAGRLIKSCCSAWPHRCRGACQLVSFVPWCHMCSPHQRLAIASMWLVCERSAVVQAHGQSHVIDWHHTAPADGKLLVMCVHQKALLVRLVLSPWVVAIQQPSGRIGSGRHVQCIGLIWFVDCCGCCCCWRTCNVANIEPLDERCTRCDIGCTHQHLMVGLSVDLSTR
jgi:hypothetical protein